MPELPTPPQPPSAASVSDEHHARLPARLRRNVAALSLVGATLVALPVVQLLRYQSSELDALNAGRAKLDPVARAVHLQRGLLAHRDIAGQVLGGLAGLEPERQLRQREVDGRMAAMMVALATGRWDQAVGEADDLHQDWRQLTQQVASHSIDPPGSDRAHRLLVEQTLQVIDLVAAATQIENTSGTAYTPGSVPAATLAIVHTLPRLAWQTTLLAPGAVPDGSTPNSENLQQQMRRVEGSLARTLGLLEGTRRPADRATSAAATPTEVALLQAGAAAGASTERYFNLLRRTGASAAETQAAGLAAVQSQMRLFELAHGTATATLTAQTRSAVQQRSLLLGALTALALLALSLLARLWRGLLLLQRQEQAQADHAAAPDAGSDQAARQAQAEQLLQRLRTTPAEAAAAPASDAAAAPSPHPLS
jgi:hypothetical protein